jgi:hypothetical protein
MTSMLGVCESNVIEIRNFKKKKDIGLLKVITQIPWCLAGGLLEIQFLSGSGLLAD